MAAAGADRAAVSSTGEAGMKREENAVDQVQDGGEAILEAIRRLGIDYVMSSPGSEWGAVWEAFARQPRPTPPTPGSTSSVNRAARAMPMAPMPSRWSASWTILPSSVCMGESVPAPLNDMSAMIFRTSLMVGPLTLTFRSRLVIVFWDFFVLP